MKIKYLIGILVILSLMIGCASKEAPVEEPVAAPVEEPEEVEPVVAEELEEVEVSEEEPVAEEGGDFILNGKSGFDPESMNIKKGSTLVFKIASDDKVRHAIQVRGDGEAGKSGSLGAGETYSYTFENAGEFEVMDVNFGKKLRVTVE